MIFRAFLLTVGVTLFNGLGSAVAEQASTATSSHTPVMPFESELSVTGDAAYEEAPNSASFLLRVSQTSATAREAHASLTERMDAFYANLKILEPTVRMRLRSDIYPGMEQTGGLKPGPLTIIRVFDISCDAPSKIAALIDSAVQQPGASVQDVRFAVRSTGQPLLDAIALATERAKQKAQLVAGKLNVQLGSLLSAVATEEPEGQMLRERLQQGGDSLNYGDKELRIFVTLRYSIQR